MGFSKTVGSEGNAGSNGSNGSDGAMVLLSTQTASSSASLTFDNIFTSSYDTYLVKWFDIVPATNNVNFGCILRDSSPADITGTYYYGFLYCQIGAAASGAAGSSLSYALLLDGLSSTAGSGSGSGSFFFEPRTTQYKRWVIAASRLYYTGNSYINNCGIVFLNTTQASGIRFFCSSGNISTGTVQIFGLKNS